jgi:hypothetical protein
MIMLDVRFVPLGTIGAFNPNRTISNAFDLKKKSIIIVAKRVACIASPAPSQIQLYYFTA